MATTIDEIIRDIIGSVSTTAGAPVIARWINNRYKELVTKVKFRHLRKVGELSIPEIVSEGAVTVSKNSTTVTLDATAQTVVLAALGTGAIEHWFLRVKNNWYRISTVAAGAVTIELESAFVESNQTGSTYQIVKRYHSLDSTVRWLGTMTLARLSLEIENLSITELDIISPGRQFVGGIPANSAQIGVDSTGNLLYEIYPVSANAEILHYIYWSLPAELTFNTTIPSVIDSDILKEAALIDVYRFEKTQQIKLGNIEAAAIYSNEEAKQRTLWKEKIKDAIRSSRGSDDITLILSMFRGKQSNTGGYSRTESAEGVIFGGSTVTW